MSEKKYVIERSRMDEFENAIRRIGVECACEWFGHPKDSTFTKDTIATLDERLAQDIERESRCDND